MKNVYLIKWTWITFMAVFISFNALSYPASGKTPQSPFYFIENIGQIKDQHRKDRQDIDFRISSEGVNVFIGNGKLHYQWSKLETTEGELPDMDKYWAIKEKRRELEMLSGKDEKLKALDAEAIDPLQLVTYRMDVTLVGANPNARLIKEDKQQFFERYYHWSVKEEGAKAHAYKKIVYKDIYPNIDWIIYVKGQHIEHDFIVHPGGSVSDIKIQYNGATDLQLNEDGSLTASTPFGQVNEVAPYSYQQDGEAVSSHYVLTDNILTFETGHYSGTLTIDPTLVWGTYLGSGAIYSAGGGNTLDNQGNALMVGVIYSFGNVATNGSHQDTSSYLEDAFLTKFDEHGDRMWTTYYGGDGIDRGNAVKVDGSGNIFLAGETKSLNSISTLGSHQYLHGGSQFLDTVFAITSLNYDGQLVIMAKNYDAFLIKFDSLGTRLWGTYYGGDKHDDGHSLAIQEENVYMQGNTSSSLGIATVGSFLDAYQGASDAFIAKFNSQGARIWATYYGDNQTNLGYDLAVDNSGNIYIAGYSWEASLPLGSSLATLNSHQNFSAGGDEAFLAKFDSQGFRTWATYYGGPGNDFGKAVACDNWGNVYLAGYTENDINISTSCSYQEYRNSIGQGTFTPDVYDGFLVKFDSLGNREWGTYFGGTRSDYIEAIHCLNSTLIIKGSTFSDSLMATSGVHQETLGGGQDIFLASFDYLGNKLWCTYYGGDKNDAGGGEYSSLTVDKMEINMYISGATNSRSGIATVGSWIDTMDSSNWISDAYLSKFEIPSLDSTHIAIYGPDSVCANQEYSYYIPEVEHALSYYWILPNNWTGASDSTSIQVTTGSEDGNILLKVLKCGDTITIGFKVNVYTRNPAEITINEFELGTLQSYAAYQWCKDGVPIPGATDSIYTVPENGFYSVITTSENGCIDTSEKYEVLNAGIEGIHRLHKSISIYPNPANNILRIHSPVSVDLSISSIDGKFISQKQDVKQISVKHLVPGMYLLSIRDRKGSLIKVEKFVKTE